MSDPRDRSGSALDDTVAASAATSETVAAEARDASLIAAAETVAASGSVTSPSASVITSSPSAVTADSRVSSDVARSTVGNELRGATVERFSRVGRERFELLDELARGGLGRVFRARDPRTGRIVAIKEVLRAQPDIMLRFAREALVTANLQHPSIVPVYEVGRWPDGEPFYAMKLVEGRTLDALIRDAATTEQRVALLSHVIDVADAVAYAHGERVIHRDLKPANILVGAYGETVVIDWGLAKNVATGEELDALPVASTLPPDQDETVVGAVVGTPAYMAPEQALGDKLDERADVYAIGAILYHALGGARPYAEAQGVGELIAMVASRPPRPLPELAPDLPAELLAIVAKAMARDPAARYPTARELALDLRRFQSGQIVGAHRYTSRQLVRRWIARHRTLVAASTVALAVAVVVGALAIRGIARERDEADRQRGIAQRERADATAARELAERRFADSLEELARQAVLAREPERALPLLAGAAAGRGGAAAALDGPAGVLAARALATYDGFLGVAPGPAGSVTSGFVHDGVVVTADRAGTIRGWDLAARRERWSHAGAWLIAPSASGALALGVDATGAVSVRRAADGELVGRWQVPAGSDVEAPSLLAWGGDARFALVTADGRLYLGAPDAPALIAGAPRRGAIHALAFSPDGKTLAAAGADGVTTLHDAATGALLARLVPDAPSDPADALWLDDGRLVTGDAQGVARVWDVARRRVVRALRHPADIYGLAASRGPTPWLATFGHGQVVVVWDPDTGAERARLDGHVHGTDLAGGAGATLVTTDEAGNAHVWDASTGQRLASLPNEGPLLHASVSRDGVVALYGEARIRVWSRVSAGLTQLEGHTARIRGLEIAAGAAGDVVWTASHDGTARGVTLATGAAVVLGEPGQFTEPPMRVAPATLPPIYPGGLRSLRVSPDGETVFTAGEDGTIGVWDARASAPAPRAVWRGHVGRVRHLVLSRDGRFAYSVDSTTLRKWDVATGAQLAEAPLPDRGWEVALADGEQVVVVLTEAAQQTVLARAADLAPISVITDRHLPPTIVADDARVLIAGRLRLAAVAVAGVGAGRAVADGAFTVTSAAALGPVDRPRWLVVGSQVGDATLFTWPELTPVRSWRADQGILATRFRPDGAIVATIGGRYLRLWDPATGRLLDELEASFLLTQLAWSPDGRRLAVAGASGTVLVWDLTPPDPARLAAVTRCTSPWRLEDAVLVAAPFDADACAALRP